MPLFDTRAIHDPFEKLDALAVAVSVSQEHHGLCRVQRLLGYRRPDSVNVASSRVAHDPEGNSCQMRRPRSYRPAAMHLRMSFFPRYDQAEWKGPLDSRSMQARATDQVRKRT